MRLFDSHFSGRISSRVELQIAQMYGPLADPDGLLVSVAALQQQSPRSFNCGPLCIAAAYHAAKGDNLAEMTFDENKLRQHLVNYFERQELTPFPLAPPEKTVRRAKQQNILIEIHCTCGRPDTFDDMVACDGCDHWFHLSCVNMEDIPQGDWFCTDCAQENNE